MINCCNEKNNQGQEKHNCCKYSTVLTKNEKFEVNKGVIRSRKSKDRQYND